MIKILLVEDDAFLVQVYKLKLEKAGFDVTYLENGEQVLSQAEKLKPDLILLDIILPVKDGFAVLEELKHHPATQKIPVLVLSALQMDEDIARGQALGAAEYLAKTNVSMDQVIERIHALTHQ